MCVTIENDFLKIQVQHFGAELCSLIKKSTQMEYIWEADPTHWGRHSPILFPVVGRLQNNQYLVGEKSYNLGQHGFARNMEFELIKQTNTALTFELKNSEITLEKYPFPFQLQVKYALDKNQLIITYQVLNPSDNSLYFSIGAHPAFRCPLHSEERRADYQLVFEEKEKAFTQRLDKGIRNGKTDLVLDNQQYLPISDNLFEHDALIFEQLKSNWVRLQKGEKQLLTFHFSGFPYLGIWSKSDTSPFVCIEPWFGIADHVKHNQQLSQKEGVLELTAQKKFECAYVIEIH